MSALLRFLLQSENSLIKPKATILILKSSGATKGSDYEFAPSSPAFGAAEAQDGLHRHSTTRVLRGRTFSAQWPCYQ